MVDYGFIIPVTAEATPLLKALDKKKRTKKGSRTVFTGIFQHKTVSLIVSGCGKIKSASATQYLIDTYPANVYIHYGTAGALSDSLKIGDVIVATQVIEHDVIELFPKKVPAPVYSIYIKQLKKQLKNYQSSPIVFGPIISGDEDIVTTIRKKELFHRYKGLSADWESAGFILTCQLNNVRGCVFRGISDYAYEHTSDEYEINQLLVVNNMLHLCTHLFKG